MYNGQRARKANARKKVTAKKVNSQKFLNKSIWVRGRGRSREL
jgi:hypothetical protein